MHWLIPFAFGFSPDAAQVLQSGLALPNLAALLRRLDSTGRDEAAATTLSPPHERAFAAAVGWHGADGALPFAALAAERDGLATGAEAWALVTPCHWQVGRDHVSLVDPAALALGEEEARGFFAAARELFDGAGFALHWGAPDRWYARAAALDGLPCAALDRAVGRDVQPWLRPSADHAEVGRRLRRLQSEFQLLLYPHPLNDAREARGEWTLNSFWLSGCGRAQALAGTPPTVDDRLRAPLLAGDAAAWAAAWRALDAGPLAEALAAAKHGGQVTLTLCGERAAQTWTAAPRSLWRRLGSGLGLGAAPAPATVLASL